MIILNNSNINALELNNKRGVVAIKNGIFSFANAESRAISIYNADQAVIDFNTWKVSVNAKDYGSVANTSFPCGCSNHDSCGDFIFDGKNSANIFNNKVNLTSIVLRNFKNCYSIGADKNFIFNDANYTLLNSSSSAIPLQSIFRHVVNSYQMFMNCNNYNGIPWLPYTNINKGSSVEYIKDTNIPTWCYCQSMYRNCQNVNNSVQIIINNVNYNMSSTFMNSRPVNLFLENCIIRHVENYIGYVNLSGTWVPSQISNFNIIAPATSHFYIKGNVNWEIPHRFTMPTEWGMSVNLSNNEIAMSYLNCIRMFSNKRLHLIENSRLRPRAIDNGCFNIYNYNNGNMSLNGAFTRYFADAQIWTNNNAYIEKFYSSNATGVSELTDLNYNSWCMMGTETFRNMILYHPNGVKSNANNPVWFDSVFNVNKDMNIWNYRGNVTFYAFLYRTFENGRFGVRNLNINYTDRLNLNTFTNLDCIENCIIYHNYNNYININEAWRELYAFAAQRINNCNFTVGYMNDNRAGFAVNTFASFSNSIITNSYIKLFQQCDRFVFRNCLSIKLLINSYFTYRLNNRVYIDDLAVNANYQNSYINISSTIYPNDNFRYLNTGFNNCIFNNNCRLIIIGNYKLYGLFRDSIINNSSITLYGLNSENTELHDVNTYWNLASVQLQDAIIYNSVINSTNIKFERRANFPTNYIYNPTYADINNASLTIFNSCNFIFAGASSSASLVGTDYLHLDGFGFGKTLLGVGTFHIGSNWSLTNWLGMLRNVTSASVWKPAQYIAYVGDTNTIYSEGGRSVNVYKSFLNSPVWYLDCASMLYKNDANIMPSTTLSNYMGAIGSPGYSGKVICPNLDYIFLTKIPQMMIELNYNTVNNWTKTEMVARIKNNVADILSSSFTSLNFAWNCKDTKLFVQANSANTILTTLLMRLTSEVNYNTNFFFNRNVDYIKVGTDYESTTYPDVSGYCYTITNSGESETSNFNSRFNFSNIRSYAIFGPDVNKWSDCKGNTIRLGRYIIMTITKYLVSGIQEYVKNYVTISPYGDNLKIYCNYNRDFVTRFYNNEIKPLM